MEGTRRSGGDMEVWRGHGGVEGAGGVEGQEGVDGTRGQGGVKSPEVCIFPFLPKAN